MRPFAHTAARAAKQSYRATLGFRLELRSSIVPAGPSRPSIWDSVVRTHPATFPSNLHIRAYSSKLPGQDDRPEPSTQESPSQEPSTQESSIKESTQDAAETKEPGPDTEPTPSSPHELPSATESKRSQLNKKLSKLMDDIQVRAFHASQTLNDITGYSGIDKIKAENEALEASLAEAQTAVRVARLAYKTSNTKRANTQREVTTLLARKDGWSPDDLERFTKLYRADHELEGEVAAAQEALTEAEAAEQKLNQKLNSGILRRYHEEQIWSDRIRRASTWGTWGLMGMNFLLFFILQFVAEPWKRRRLVKGVVAEEKQALEEVRSELAALRATVEEQRAPLPAAVAEVEVEVEAEAPTPAEIEPVVVTPAVESIPASSIWADLWSHPATWELSMWKEAALDLQSERRIDLRMKDASLLALEGAIAGATIVGTVVLALTWRS